ncbi:MAG TPA: DUF1344 domain-containing protein [Rhizomicrobium sp.]|jgi:hypothetical protein|nr:DUF1344 domain-containing protein [Rhizomicrobium sp.]
MKKFLVPAIACLLALGSSASQAWTHVKGSISSLDPTAHTLTLDNGTTYDVQSGVKLSNLAVGDKVTISTETKSGQHLVNKVTKTS